MFFMKMNKLLGMRFKETPADCQIASHIFMLRGGYIKNVGSGIFSLFTPAKRIAHKIENILREEMERVDGQEVMLPVVMPAFLWKESGRYEGVGNELVRFHDRNDVDMILGMTHEEAVVHLARDTAQSYINYPFMVYQIQTKFRDEPRARGGLIRVREFTMKDAYSFHTDEEDLEQYYERCHEAYERIFARVGIPEVISVKSDSGMMGGKIAHEFMLLTDIGEDALVICSQCDYRANMEAADCITKNEMQTESELDKTPTPNVKTIEELGKFFNVSFDKICKAVVYQKTMSGDFVIVFIRGDLDVNETKLRNYLKNEIHPAAETDLSGLQYGYIGPVNLAASATILFDNSLRDAFNLICGANEEGYHFKNFSINRDLKQTPLFGNFAKAREGGICPVCKKESLTIKKGIEVGNIFQLGTKYTKSMEMQYIDKDGAAKYPIMGCYGIGVGRLMASVCEVRHDKFGIIWPISIAPWQVHICAIRSDDQNVKNIADNLYECLISKGIEVIYDDRSVSAGVMFSDADLLGVPIRVIVSPKTYDRGVVEVTARDKSFSKDIEISDAGTFISSTIKSMLEIYRI